MNSASIDIKDLLLLETSFDLAFADNLYVGKEPPKPDNCVTIFDTPGRPPVLTLNAKESPEYYFPSVQIRVRNNLYIFGWNLLHEITRFLHAVNMQMINGTVYELIKCTMAPMMLDWDLEDRVRFVATFDIQRRD